MRTTAAGFLIAITLGLGASSAWAGGGPTTTLVVANGDSPTSLYVATQYMQMRGIPNGNLCRLHDLPNRAVITVDQFRTRVWTPIAAFMKAQGIAGSIDCITYSTDFPFGVNFVADFDGKSPTPRVPPVASLNSMTFLARRVMEKDKNYIGHAANKYCRVQDRMLLDSHSFRGTDLWNRKKTPDFEPDLTDEPVDRYWLSTLLGFSGLQGNTTEEILSYLKVGVDTDGTRPKGTVYLMSNKDVRSTTRKPMFEEATEELAKRKRKFKIIQHTDEGQDGKVPMGCTDVLGVVGGIASFNWAKSASRMAPGAIAEHLTSFGGRLDGSGQTKLTAFLRAGAIGSSGTVAEPLALWWKFPTPFIHVHYADGCSLAESFYQSVSGPYQLLIVGEPLARPFARFDATQVGAFDTSASHKGTIIIQPTGIQSAPDTDDTSARYEVFVGSRRVGQGAPGTPIEIDTTTLDDGHHTLRVVGVAAGPIATRSLAKPLPLKVGNTERKCSIKGPRKPVDLDDIIKLRGRVSGKSETIQVRHGATVLATVTSKGSSWKAQIPAHALARGEHAVFARATFEEGPAVRSAPVTVTVQSATGPDGRKTKKRRSSRKKKSDKKTDAPKVKGKSGLMAEVTDAKGKTHAIPIAWIGRQGKQWFHRLLRNKVKGKLSRIVLTGELHVETDGVYHLAVNATGDLKLAVHGKTIFEQDDMAFDKQRYVEFQLRAGWHPIRVEYGVKGNGDLSLQLGGAQVTQVLSGKRIRH